MKVARIRECNALTLRERTAKAGGKHGSKGRLKEVSGLTPYMNPYGCEGFMQRPLKAYTDGEVQPHSLLQHHTALTVKLETQKKNPCTNSTVVSDGFRAGLGDDISERVGEGDYDEGGGAEEQGGGEVG